MSSQTIRELEQKTSDSDRVASPQEHWLVGSSIGGLVHSLEDVFVPVSILEARKRIEEEAEYFSRFKEMEGIDAALFDKELDKMRAALPKIIEEANDARTEMGFYFNPAVGSYLGMKGRAVIGLAPIDLETGQSLADPKILGELDEETGEIKRQDESKEFTRKIRDWVREIYEKYPNLTYGFLPLREGLPKIEGEATGKIEQR